MRKRPRCRSASDDVRFMYADLAAARLPQRAGAAADVLADAGDLRCGPVAMR